ncbi:MAG: zinc ribbon domain-containing protein [Chloroflexota bacterium]
MKRIFLLTLLVVLISISVPVSAQQEITFEVVQVQFWPEYDRPSMLVITTIELPENISLPVNISVRIPADAGEPNAVAVAKGEQLLTAAYTREVVGDWAELVVTADSNVLHIEYYDPGLEIDELDRAYDFSWIGLYAVDELIVRVQTPIGAAEMEFSSDLGVPELASDGLSYYLGNFGALEAGEQFDFSMAYQKNSSTLTVDAFADQTSVSEPAPSEATGLLSNAPDWLWFVVGIGVILIAMGIGFLLKDSSKSTKHKKSKYTQKKQAAASSRTGKKGSKFCHKCGNAALAGDKFCRECGEKLRV